MTGISQFASYRVVARSIDGRAVAIARGLLRQEAIRVCDGLENSRPELLVVIEPESDVAQEHPDPPVFQIVAVGFDQSRAVLMTGMTLDQAEAGRDAVMTTDDFVWAWVERESV